MKTTIELPDPLFRHAKILAARRGTTLRELVVEGLRHVTTTGPAPTGAAPRLTTEESTVAVIGALCISVLLSLVATPTVYLILVRAFSRAR